MTRAEVLGLAGRAFVEAHFDRDRLTASLERRLVALTRARAPAVEPPDSVGSPRSTP